MLSVGSYLRELRERRGVSLDEIARVTRVGRSYLEALEAGDFAKLPAPVFTRGFIRAYCQALGEPLEDALARYENRVREPADEPRQPLPQEARGRGHVMVSFVLLVVLGAALFGVTLALRSGRDGGERRSESPARAERSGGTSVAAPVPPAPVTEVSSVTGAGQPTPASAGGPASTGVPAPDAGVDRSPSVPVSVPVARPQAPLAATPPAMIPAVPPKPVERPAVASTPPPIASSGTRAAERATAGAVAPYRLVARTAEATWMRVRTEDGRQLSEETIPPGQVREWVSNRRFNLAIGNAGGVRLELNGQAIPALGPSGAVIPRLALPPEAP